jgi:hypothetical protein
MHEAELRSHQQHRPHHKPVLQVLHPWRVALAQKGSEVSRQLNQFLPMGPDKDLVAAVRSGLSFEKFTLLDVNIELEEMIAKQTMLY